MAKIAKGKHPGKGVPLALSILEGFSIILTMDGKQVKLAR